MPDNIAPMQPERRPRSSRHFAVASLVRLWFAMMLLGVAPFAASHAQQPAPATPPNTPLSFGMNAAQASAALGVPLNYVRGRPGDELFLALPNVKGSALASRSDGLYLQFRHGRLSGWKGDWGTIRP